MKTAHSLALFSILLIFLLPCKYLKGETDFKGFSVNPGVGVFYNADGGFLLGMQFSKFKNSTIYSVDYFGFGEFTLMDPIPGNTYNQIGLMIGKNNRHKIFRLQYQGGIAPFFGKLHQEQISGEPDMPSYQYYVTDKFLTVGLVAKLGFKLLLTKNFAIGAALHTNVNLKRSVFFPSLGLEIGKLKEE